MTLVFLRYPLLPALLILSTLLALLACTLRRGSLIAAVLAAISTVGLVLAALACSVPYTELLLMLLLPVLVCALALWKGERS